MENRSRRPDSTAAEHTARRAWSKDQADQTQIRDRKNRTEAHTEARQHKTKGKEREKLKLMKSRHWRKVQQPSHTNGGDRLWSALLSFACSFVTQQKYMHQWLGEMLMLLSCCFSSIANWSGIGSTVSRFKAVGHYRFAFIHFSTNRTSKS